MAKVKSNKVITPRDLSLFEYLYENRVATFKQISRDIFRGKSKCVINKRIAKLCNGGWIKRNVVLFNNRTTHTFSIAQKTFKSIIENDLFDYNHTQIKSDSLKHDVTLNDIRHYLCKLSTVTDYKTENIILQSKTYDSMSYINVSNYIKSDAMLTVTINQNKKFVFPLEYESKSKEPKRYAQKLAQYYSTNQYNMVLYVVSATSIQDNLIQAEKDLVEDDRYRLYFCSIDDVINHSGSVTFTNQKGGTIMID